MKYTVLIADKLPESASAKLAELGCKVIEEAELNGDALRSAIEKHLPHLIIVRSTKITKDMILADPNLSLIIRAGAGYNNIDVETASARSIYVANCPGRNSIAVAELAFGLMLSLDRSIPDNTADLRKGIWNKKKYSKATGLFGRTLGIIGLGRIGFEVAARARAFGMRVIAWDVYHFYEKSRELGVTYTETPGDVAAEADIVTVHLALSDQTKHLIDKDFFSKMKEGAFFINTSRAAIVDNEALLDVLEKKNIRAGIDVFEEEPAEKQGTINGKLSAHPNVYGTHHIGASTEQAQNAVAKEAVSIVEAFVSSGEIKNCVNLLERTEAPFMLSVHHRNRVGILASVLEFIRKKEINVELMDNEIFSGGEGACASIQISGSLSDEDLRVIEASHEDIFSVVQSRL